MTEGRLPKEASLQISTTLSTALTPEATTSQLCRNTFDADAGAIDLAGASAAGIAEQYESAIRLQSMTGQVCLVLSSESTDHNFLKTFHVTYQQRVLIHFLIMIADMQLGIISKDLAICSGSLCTFFRCLSVCLQSAACYCMTTL